MDVPELTSEEQTVTTQDLQHRPVPFISSLILALLGKSAAGLGRLSYANALTLVRGLMPCFAIPTSRARQTNFQRYFAPAGWTNADCRRLERAYVRYVARVGVDIARGFVLTPAQLRNVVTLSGEDHLRAGLAGGRGLMLISGHRGTWWYIPSLIAAHGYPVTALFDTMPGSGVNEFLTRLGSRFGVKLAFVGNGAYSAVRRALEKNEIVYVAFEHSARQTRSSWFSFGHLSLFVDHAPAIMAIRHRVPVVYASNTQLTAPLSQVSLRTVADAVENRPKEPALLIQNWLNVLYEDVMRQPDQWWPWTGANLRSTAELKSFMASTPLSVPRMADCRMSSTNAANIMRVFK